MKGCLHVCLKHLVLGMLTKESEQLRETEEGERVRGLE